MKRNTIKYIGVVCIFLLVQCRGLLTRQDEVDKAQIKKFHHAEQEAIDILDYETLQAMWAEDGVLLPPDNAPVRGIEAISIWNHAHKPDPSIVELIQMKQEFEEVQVAGSWAFEWGTYTSTVRMIANGDTLVSSGKILRILRKEASGNWKIARSIWNETEMK